MGHLAAAALGEDVAILRRLLPQIQPGAALVVVAQAPIAFAEVVGEARQAHAEDVLPWSLMDHTPWSGWRSRDTGGSLARDDATGLRPRREHGALVAGPLGGVQLTRRGAEISRTLVLGPAGMA